MCSLCETSEEMSEHIVLSCPFPVLREMREGQWGAPIVQWSEMYEHGSIKWDVFSRTIRPSMPISYVELLGFVEEGEGEVE